MDFDQTSHTYREFLDKFEFQIHRVKVKVNVVNPASYTTFLRYCQNSLGVHLSITIVQPASETTCLLFLSYLPWRPPVYNYCQFSLEFTCMLLLSNLHRISPVLYYCQNSLRVHLSITIVQPASETTCLLFLSYIFLYLPWRPCICV